MEKYKYKKGDCVYENDLLTDMQAFRNALPEITGRVLARLTYDNVPVYLVMTEGAPDGTWYPEDRLISHEEILSLGIVLDEPESESATGSESDDRKVMLGETLIFQTPGDGQVPENDSLLHEEEGIEELEEAWLDENTQPSEVKQNPISGIFNKFVRSGTRKSVSGSDMELQSASAASVNVEGAGGYGLPLEVMDRLGRLEQSVSQNSQICSLIEEQIMNIADTMNNVLLPAIYKLHSERKRDRGLLEALAARPVQAEKQPELHRAEGAALASPPPVPSGTRIGESAKDSSAFRAVPAAHVSGKDSSTFRAVKLPCLPAEKSTGDLPDLLHSLPDVLDGIKQSLAHQNNAIQAIKKDVEQHCQRMENCMAKMEQSSPTREAVSDVDYSSPGKSHSMLQINSADGKSRKQPESAVIEDKLPDENKRSCVNTTQNSGTKKPSFVKIPPMPAVNKASANQKMDKSDSNNENRSDISNRINDNSFAPSNSSVKLTQLADKKIKPTVGEQNSAEAEDSDFENWLLELRSVVRPKKVDEK